MRKHRLRLPLLPLQLRLLELLKLLETMLWRDNLKDPEAPVPLDLAEDLTDHLLEADEADPVDLKEAHQRRSSRRELLR